MTIRRFTRRVLAAEAGQRLDGLASGWLQAVLGRPLSKSVIRRLIMAGAIRVNGRPATRPGLLLPAEARIAAAIDEARLPGVEATEARPGELQVLFEDAALIAVAKRPGLQVHRAADPLCQDLFTLVRRYLAARGRSTGLPYLGLHHRLDRDTSGVVLFTKVPEANSGLAAQFAARSIEKIYHALTGRAGEATREQWHLENRLAQLGKGRSARMESVNEGGQDAMTTFTLVERFPSGLLVEARPHTGRKHQVRAHLRELGMPILGDARYDGARRVGELVVPRAMLHARRLVLRHPLGGERLAIDCDYPGDFRAVLQYLRARLP